MTDTVTLIFSILGAIAWIVALGGLAAVTSVDGMTQSSTALGWWTLWFQFFLLIFGIVVALGGLSCARLRTDLTLIVTTLWCIIAWEANKVLDSELATGKLESGTGALMAGAILILILNFLSIIYWGMTSDGTMPLQIGRKTDATKGTAGPPPVGPQDFPPVTPQMAPKPTVTIETV